VKTRIRNLRFSDDTVDSGDQNKIRDKPCDENSNSTYYHYASICDSPADNNPSSNASANDQSDRSILQDITNGKFTNFQEDLGDISSHDLQPYCLAPANTLLEDCRQNIGSAETSTPKQRSKNRHRNLSSQNVQTKKEIAKASKFQKRHLKEPFQDDIYEESLENLLVRELF